ncbi:MAG: prolyl-tRNA synthetase associated domain-containing protein [Lachnospiraceae bacterium]|nr:prolyl-tRNA synthetase associated domain-containing protein [Lachnospiraceae bacterium]
MKVQQGRPETTEGRLEKEIRTYDFLDQLNVPYERIDHGQLETMDDCKEVDEVIQAVICKNLFLCNSQKTKFYLLMTRGEKKFKTKELSAQIDSARLSFATAEYMEEYLDILPGSVSVLGLMNDLKNHVQLLIDEDIYHSEYVGCHPCINTSSLKIKMEDILNKFLPSVGHTPIVVKL